MMEKARAGEYSAIHIGFPCSTGALARLFEADGDDPSRDEIRLRPSAAP